MSRTAQRAATRITDENILLNNRWAYCCYRHGDRFIASASAGLKVRRDNHVLGDVEYNAGSYISQITAPCVKGIVLVRNGGHCYTLPRIIGSSGSNRN